ncbi:MAG: MFS transporter [Planctomycetota bacterium]|nr:MFS transporter [Planctomycetota bacterium]
MSTDSSASLPPLTRVQWLICIIASIGFAFDIYELLMLPLIIKPMIESLAPKNLSPEEYAVWARLMFFAPALFGGIFGMVGGYLTDRLGRRRVLTWSILLYAFSAFGAGFATSLPMLLALRCLTFVGVCVEFVAAVAWLAELFPEPKLREKVLGYTQAFSSVGGLLVSAVYIGIVHFQDRFPAIYGQHETWRYMLISGVFPAIPLIFIRPFLPESPSWQKKKDEGTLKRPSMLELFAPKYRQTTIITTIMFACSYGAAFGAIQQLPQIVPGLEDVQQQAKAASEAPGANAASGKKAELAAIGGVSLVQEIGGLVGRFILAYLAVIIISRRKLMRVFQLPGLLIVPLVFYYLSFTDLTWLKVGAFLAGLFTVAQFSFWGNYLPRMYPVYLRGTGESFAANIGGRIFGTSFALVTISIAESAWLSAALPDGNRALKYAYTAAAVALFVYAVGSIACFFLPEPPAEEIAD